MHQAWLERLIDPRSSEWEDSDRMDITLRRHNRPGFVVHELPVEIPCLTNSSRENRVNQSGSVALSTEAMRGPP